MRSPITGGREREVVRSPVTDRGREGSGEEPCHREREVVRSPVRGTGRGKCPVTGGERGKWDNEYDTLCWINDTSD